MCVKLTLLEVKILAWSVSHNKFSFKLGKLGNTVLTSMAILMLYNSSVLWIENTDVVCITKWLYFCKLLAKSTEWASSLQAAHRCTHQLIPFEPEHQTVSSNCLSQPFLIAFGGELWWIYFQPHIGNDMADLYITYYSGISSGYVVIFPFILSPIKKG